MERHLPRDGDVLVSHPVARIECDIAILPREPHAIHARQDIALANAVLLAESLGVDAWFTQDRRHFRRVASFRPAGPELTTGHGAEPHPPDHAAMRVDGPPDGQDIA